MMIALLVVLSELLVCKNPHFCFCFLKGVGETGCGPSGTWDKSHWLVRLATR